MIVQNWVTVLQQSFNGMLAAVVAFIPNFVFAIIVFVIGWVLAAFVGSLVAQAIRAIKVDHALRAAGIDDIVSRAGYRLDSGAFLGALVKWFIILVFLIAALQIMNLAAVTFFLQAVVVSFLPNVIIAVLILLVTAVIAELAQGVVAGSARAAGITAAGFVRPHAGLSGSSASPPLSRSSKSRRASSSRSLRAWWWRSRWRLAWHSAWAVRRQRPPSSPRSAQKSSTTNQSFGSHQNAPHPGAFLFCLHSHLFSV